MSGSSAFELRNNTNESLTGRKWGSGSPKREFLFADDLAEACYFLMQTYNEANL